jgi:hypothetical protein
MGLSAFGDRDSPPDEESLGKTLGKASAAWATLKAGAAIRGTLAEEWAFSAPAAGWSLRLKDGKRVIVYMTPQKGKFLVSFALGEKAVAAARAAGLPSALLAAIDAAPRYAEGRGFRVEVRTAKEAGPIAALAALKRAN